MLLNRWDLAIVGIPFALVLATAACTRRYLRSVADYLAASRCAGRYLITSAAGETTVGVMTLITGLEVFSKTGFSLSYWSGFLTVITFFIGILGLLSYRMRETRSLTFHQFFEVRYSKSVRVMASFLNVFSGIFNFGVQPAVGARFFVYFCGLPEQTHLYGATTVPTFAVIMVILMAFSILLTLSGGQISVMITDATESMLSALFYIVIAGFVIATVSVGQMRGALLSGPPGKSFIDPFDISGQPDFNGWYIVLGLVLSIYQYRGGGQGFYAAARNPHESRMAGILMNWRGHNHNAMVVLVSLAAFTVLNHPDFAGLRATVEHGLQNVGSEQLKTQMRMPMALGVLFTPGVRGCFCAVALFGLLAAQGFQIHSYGSTFLQDVVVPLRRTPFEPKQHVRWLRGCGLGVALFALVFSLVFKPMDYLAMITKLIGAIYLGGVGGVVWGGLYWKRGTSQGALASLGFGATLAILLNVLTQFWTSVAPFAARVAGPGALSRYLADHAAKCPLNGIELSFGVGLLAAVIYVVVSWLTCREPYNMDAMLHRGAYRIEREPDTRPAVITRRWFARLVNITPQFTTGDKWLAYLTLAWTLTWKVVALAILLWSLLVGRLSPAWWFGYTIIAHVWVAVALGAIVTVWFTWGVVRDMRDLFRTLETVRRNPADDGTVRNHHNLGEENVGPGDNNGRKPAP